MNNYKKSDGNDIAAATDKSQHFTIRYIGTNLFQFDKLKVRIDTNYKSADVGTEAVYFGNKKYYMAGFSPDNPDELIGIVIEKANI